MQANPETAKYGLRPEGENRTFQRVTVQLQGRLMLENREEFDCTVVDMSPGDAYFSTMAMPRVSERVIAYIEHLGRLDGTVAKVMPAGGFVALINATERKREKFAAQLTWLANKRELGLPEDRRHERVEPRRTLSELSLEDGRKYPCRIIDLSLSGAAIDIEVRPAIGTPVRLGHMRGRIVRQFQEGVAIEFLALQTKDSLSGLM
jgi:hypothetical protein